MYHLGCYLKDPDHPEKKKHIPDARRWLLRAHELGVREASEPLAEVLLMGETGCSFGALLFISASCALAVTVVTEQELSRIVKLAAWEQERFSLPPPLRRLILLYALTVIFPEDCEPVHAQGPKYTPQELARIEAERALAAASLCSA